MDRPQEWVGARAGTRDCPTFGSGLASLGVHEMTSRPASRSPRQDLYSRNWLGSAVFCWVCVPFHFCSRNEREMRWTWRCQSVRTAQITIMHIPSSVSTPPFRFIGLTPLMVVTRGSTHNVVTSVNWIGWSRSKFTRQAKHSQEQVSVKSSILGTFLKRTENSRSLAGTLNNPMTGWGRMGTGKATKWRRERGQTGSPTV